MISIGEVFAPKVPLIQFIIRRILPANTSVSKHSGFWRVLDSPVSRNVCVFWGEILKNVCESVKLAHKKYQKMVLKWFPLLPRPKDPLSEMPPTWLWRLQCRGMVHPKLEANLQRRFLISHKNGAVGPIPGFESKTWVSLKLWNHPRSTSSTRSLGFRYRSMANEEAIKVRPFFSTFAILLENGVICDMKWYEHIISLSSYESRTWTLWKTQTFRVAVIPQDLSEIRPHLEHHPHPSLGICSSARPVIARTRGALCQLFITAATTVIHHQQHHPPYYQLNYSSYIVT